MSSSLRSIVYLSNFYVLLRKLVSWICLTNPIVEVNSIDRINIEKLILKMMTIIYRSNLCIFHNETFTCIQLIFSRKCSQTIKTVLDFSIFKLDYLFKVFIFASFINKRFSINHLLKKMLMHIELIRPKIAFHKYFWCKCLVLNWFQ